MAPNGTTKQTSQQTLQTILPRTENSSQQQCNSTRISSIDFKWEANRLRTFHNWPLSFIDASKLAKSGFYYLNRADLVRCAFCGIEIGKWEEGDDPMRDHQRWKPHCPFLNRQDVGNVPLGSLDEENGAEPSSSSSQSYDTCGPYGIEVRPFSGPENSSFNPSLENLGIHKSTAPLWKNYGTHEARLKSYSQWPVAIKQKPDLLSDAGFYYTGKGDQTVCFHCGGGLKDWEESDDPWVEHALWFPMCTYVVLRKGKPYIDQVLKDKKAKITSKEAQALESAVPNAAIAEKGEASCKPITVAEIPAAEAVESRNEGIDDGRLCKICFMEELGVLFLPCGHIVACVKCAPALSVCAVCRNPFTATVRAYLP